MKIIQIVVDSNPDTNSLLGLGDDGELYQYENFRQPRCELRADTPSWSGKTIFANQRGAAKVISEFVGEKIFHPGCTGGWVKLPTGPRGENIQTPFPAIAPANELPKE